MTEIQVPDREVRKAFIESYSALQFSKLDPKNEVFKPVDPEVWLTPDEARSPFRRSGRRR